MFPYKLLVNHGKYINKSCKSKVFYWQKLQKLTKLTATFSNNKPKHT